MALLSSSSALLLHTAAALSLITLLWSVGYFTLVSKGQTFTEATVNVNFELLGKGTGTMKRQGRYQWLWYYTDVSLVEFGFKL